MENEVCLPLHFPTIPMTFWNQKTIHVRNRISMPDYMFQFRRSAHSSMQNILLINHTVLHDCLLPISNEDPLRVVRLYHSRELKIIQRTEDRLWDYIFFLELKLFIGNHKQTNYSKCFAEMVSWIANLPIDIYLPNSNIHKPMYTIPEYQSLTTLLHYHSITSPWYWMNKYTTPPPHSSPLSMRRGRIELPFSRSCLLHNVRSYPLDERRSLSSELIPSITTYPTTFHAFITSLHTGPPSVIYTVAIFHTNNSSVSTKTFCVPMNVRPFT